MLDIARKYVHEYGLSVISLGYKDKKPATKWTEYQKRKPTDKELVNWFNSGKKHNIGISTGKVSGLAVVDVDTPEAVQTCQDLEIPETPSVKTAKGYHWYYQFKDGVRNVQGNPMFQGIDIRGEGGYVVAPPSIHKSGHVYQWVKGKGLGDLPLAEFPEVFLNKSKSGETKKPLRNLYQGVCEGSRNQTLARLCGSWASDGLTIEEAMEMAEIWNQKNNPPLDDGELRQTVESIFKKHETGKEIVNVVTVVNDVSTLIKIIDLPIDVFSCEFQKLIGNVSAAFDIAPEAIATAALTVLSSAVGNTIRVSPKQGFYVPPFLWAAIVLPTGSGKSPAVNEITAPIRKKQSEAYLVYKEKMKEYEIEMVAFRRDKDKSSPMPELPTLEQFYVSDTTVEALSDVFETTPRGVLNYQDELSGLITGLDQYKGKGNDRQHYLDLFNATSWKIDRKSGSRFIPNVGMGIIGGIQPMVLSQVFGDDSFHDGFVQRFIFVCPDKKPLRFNRASVGDQKYWKSLLRWCYQIPLEIKNDGFVDSKILTLSGDALDAWEKFYNEYGELKTLLSEKIGGFIPKLFLYSLKLAGILHIIHGFSDDRISPVISKEVVEKAIRLTEYYFGQAAKVLKLYGKKEEPDEQKERVINTLQALQGEVSNGKLVLSRIVEKYNEGLPEHVRITPEKISSVLNNSLGLATKKSTGNYSYLLWEDEKIKLFKKAVTTVTTSTEKQPGGVTEVTEVTDDSVKNFEDIPEIEFLEVR